MSTRANIILRDGSGDELCYYQHSGGYPDGVMPMLNDFMARVRNQRIRDNTEQAGGWLMILGSSPGYCWKASTVEPSTCIHGDIAWLYIVDLSTKTVTQYEVADANKIPQSIYSGAFNNPRRANRTPKPASLLENTVTQTVPPAMLATLASLRSALELVRDSASDTHIDALRAHCANVLKNTAE